MKHFYIGWNQANNGRSGAGSFSHCLISVNRLLGRRSPFKVKNWILDSGAFTRMIDGGHLPLEEYAAIANRFYGCGNLEAVVAQDIVPRPIILKKLNCTLVESQALTIENYLKLCPLLKAYCMPVVQGIEVKDYADHLAMYSWLIDAWSWVGVGNLVGRNNQEIVSILLKIKEYRPDLFLHGFGVKLKQVKDSSIASLLYSADSVCGSFSGLGKDKMYSAIAYQNKVLTTPVDLTHEEYEAILETEDDERIREIIDCRLQYEWECAYGDGEIDFPSAWD